MHGGQEFNDNGESILHNRWMASINLAPVLTLSQGHNKWSYVVLDRIPSYLSPPAAHRQSRTVTIS